MTLTYWTAENLDEWAVGPALDIRSKTRKGAKALVAEWSDTNWGEVRKVVVEYDSAFDLLDKVQTYSRL